MGNTTVVGFARSQNGGTDSKLTIIGGDTWSVESTDVSENNVTGVVFTFESLDHVIN